MNKIADFFKKLTKIPYFLWFMVMSTASLFANLYSGADSFRATLDNLRTNGYGDVFSGAENTLFWFSLIIGAFIYVCFFELILSIIYKSFATRGMISREDKYVKNVIRGFYIVANVLVALFSLIYFALPSIYVYGIHIYNFLIYTAAYTLAFLVLETDSVNPKKVGTTFSRLFYIYFGINLVVGLLSMLGELTSQNATASSKIAYVLGFLLVLAVGGAMYFTLVKKFNKKQKEYVEIVVIDNPNDNNPPPPDEIFKGFGF